MKELKPRITENGIEYVLVGDYYIPDLKLPEENRPIGKYGQMHREYLKEQCYGRYSSLLLTGKLWSYLEDLDEQAEERIIPTHTPSIRNFAPNASASSISASSTGFTSPVPTGIM